MAKRFRARRDGRADATRGGKDAARAQPMPREMQHDIQSDQRYRGRRKQRSPVNAIAPARVLERSSVATSPRPRPAPPNAVPAHAQADARRDRRTAIVPEDIKRRFVATGNAYYFRDGTRAFVDRGDRLTTRSENAEVISSLAAIAKAREWGEVTLTGTRRFKQEMWVAARLAGLDVRGYSPHPREEARLVREIARRTPASPSTAAPGAVASRASAPSASAPSAVASRPATAESAAVRASGELARSSVLQATHGSPQWRGRLVDHGPAPYQHKPNAEGPYFVKIETPSGTKDLWGVDLDRAMRDSLSRPERGDEVVLRQVGQEAVKVRAVERDDEGRVLKETPRATHRNRWVVEKKEFFKARAEAAEVVRDPAISAKAATQRHPELTGTYLQLRAAEVAASGLRSPKDRAQFVDIVRSALADSIARGEPMPTIDVRERAQVPTPPRVRGADRVLAPERE